MDCETKLWLVVFYFFNCVVVGKAQPQSSAQAEPQIPCLFIFGDSLSDSGNNNNLPTDAKVNYLPYGIDFPLGPTGRFTNGRTSVDILTQLLGFDGFIPPFANTSGSDILKGVNYASGSAGIRKETGTHLGEDISLGLQLQNHKVIVSQITEKLGGPEQAQQHLNKCLFYVNIGTNDYINNYFLPEHYPSKQTFNPQQYADALVQEYATNLKDLHAVGARKVSLIGLGPIGCIPHEISIHGKLGEICVDEENKAATIFNDKLRQVVDRLNKELPDAKFVFVNIDLSPFKLFKVQKLHDIMICCRVGANGQCIPNGKACQDRNISPFFDEFHPTEALNQLTARIAYNSEICSLVKL